MNAKLFFFIQHFHAESDWSLALFKSGYYKSSLQEKQVGGSVRTAGAEFFLKQIRFDFYVGNEIGSYPNF